jgi:glutathione synthase/RimK-type ligase-like ATP-grasp enzyme
MKKILLVGGTSTSTRDQDRKQEQLAFMSDVLGSDAHCYLAYMDDMRYEVAPGSFRVFDNRNKIDLSEIDVVFIRGMEQIPESAAYYLSRYCAWSNTPCVSDYSMYVPSDKAAQAILFLEHDVPFLKTIYTPNAEQLVAAASKIFGYPYILKATIGSHGNDNYLIHSQAEAENALTLSPRVEFLAQEFCPNDLDYRLLLVGKRQLLFERRGGTASHLNNTSKGAQATKVTDVLPPQMIKQAQALAESLGLMLAGVDIMPHRETGELYFLEVNLQPQLRTGAFLEEKRVLIHDLFEDLYDPRG